MTTTFGLESPPQTSPTHSETAIPATVTDSSPASSDSEESEKPKVFILGMSYFHMREQLRNRSWSEERIDELLDDGITVDVAVKCVDILGRMGARDLARIAVLEGTQNVEAYTDSLEYTGKSGNHYHPLRHLCADFNDARRFKESICQCFGEDIRFRQIILDYIWFQEGVWCKEHWRPSFFGATLPMLMQFLDESGAIYLPFSPQCVTQIVANLDELKKCYKIAFVHQKNLGQNYLWSATQHIDAATMLYTFKKSRNSEEVHCTFEPSDIEEAELSSNVRKSDVIYVLKRIEDFKLVRMIRLTPLPLREPSDSSRARKKQRRVDLEAFEGLKKDVKEVKRGYDQVRKKS